MPTEINLPPHLSGPLIQILEHFAQYIPIDTIVMGGGSALAARWGHRKSTDIDLFMPDESMHGILKQDDEALDLAATTLPDVQNLDVSKFDAVEGVLQGTPFSLYGSRFISPNRKATERISGTPIQAASVQEIFAGKIAARLMELSRWASRPPPVRDLYDIAVGSHLAPDALQDVLSALPADHSDSIADHFATLENGWHLDDPKPLIDPAWDLPLGVLPLALSQVFRSRVVQDLLEVHPDGRNVPSDEAHTP